MIVAARIRLLAALKTATHHVGGRSVVIDERLPDNHQAAEGRQGTRWAAACGDGSYPVAASGPGPRLSFRPIWTGFMGSRVSISRLPPKRQGHGWADRRRRKAFAFLKG